MSTSRDYTAGSVLTAAQADDWAQGVLGYASSTADSSSTSGTTVLDVLSAPAVTINSANRLIVVYVKWRGITNATDVGHWEMMLREGSTQLNSVIKKCESLSTSQQGGSFPTYIANPSTGSHTYKLSIQRQSGTGTATVQGSSTSPIQIIVMDAGTS